MLAVTTGQAIVAPAFGSVVAQPPRRSSGASAVAA